MHKQKRQQNPEPPKNILFAGLITDILLAVTYIIAIFTAVVNMLVHNFEIRDKMGAPVFPAPGIGYPSPCKRHDHPGIARWCFGGYYKDLEKLAGELPIKNLIIDPSAASFITLVERKHRFRVWKANNAVLEGIQHTAQCLQEKIIMVNDCCGRTIQEFGLYSWDDRSAEDAVIKENDHAMDCIRYFIQTVRIYENKPGRTVPGYSF